MTDIKVRNVAKDGDRVEASEPTKQTPKRGRKSSGKSWQVIAVAILVLASVGAAVYFWRESENAKSQSTEQVAARNEEESKKIVSALDEILLTEREEDPLVARVDDPGALKKANADFYKNVQQGDYLVVFAQRAVIYRETENKVINVAPIVDTAQLQKDAKAQDSEEQ